MGIIKPLDFENALTGWEFLNDYEQKLEENKMRHIKTTRNPIDEEWIEESATMNENDLTSLQRHAKTLPSSTQLIIEDTLDNLASLLVEKNKRYGDSALKPLNLFSKQDASSSICIRLDDKLSRIKNSDELRKNDVCDIMGYLTLLCVANGWDNFSEFVD